MIRSTSRTKFAVWCLALSQISLVTGCRSDAGSGGRGGAQGSVAPGATAGPNIGEILYGVLLQSYKSGGTPEQVKLFEKSHAAFVDAVNRMLPSDVSKGLWPMIQKILPLVDDNTVGDAMKDVEDILKDLKGRQDVLQAAADLAGGASSMPLAIEPKDAIRLVSRLLSHPDFDKLARATNDLIKTQPDTLKGILGVVARQLQAISPTSLQGQGPNLQSLADALLAEVDTTGLGDLGAPAWSVRLDKNGNPKVTVDPASGKIMLPFVDDGSGTAAVDANNKPIDGSGQVITLKPFGTDGTRDPDGRLMGPGGLTVFSYFDAKKTLLGEVLVLVGQLFKKGVPNDLITVLNKVVSRVQHPDPVDPWVGFGPDNPLADLSFGGLELARRTPLPQLLEGLALVVKSDPAAFESTVTDLVLACNLAAASGFSSAGQSKMIDDLLPLISDAAKTNGKSVSALRALLRSFNSAQARLQTLPKGFARMMRFHDYGKQIPTGPGLPSVMERLLVVMDRSNGCSAPFLGNLAELYIDTMAGNNKAILGIKLNIKTMNSLLKIGFLRSLLCSQLVADDCQVLQDFVDTGTLDAFVPIAKAFSDQGETRLLIDIMLTLGKHYAAAMRPNEAAVVKLLESGSVEKLFHAIDGMTKVKIPSNGQNLIDVLADTVGAIVDDTTPIMDRNGVPQKTLLHVLKAPLDNLSATAAAAGVQAECSRAISGLAEVLLATYKDGSGKERLVHSGLVATLGSTLTFLSTAIPADKAARSTWVDQQQRSMIDLLQCRDLAALIDFVLAMKSSPNAKLFDDALAGLFTPVTASQASQDALGAITQLVAGLIQKPPTAPISASQAQALATILNWTGGILDPKAHRIDRILTLVIKFVNADDGLLILKIVRNGLDMGASGNLDPALVVVAKILLDVKAVAGGGSATSLAAMDAAVSKMLAFMADTANGLPHFLDLVKKRAK